MATEDVQQSRRLMRMYSFEASRRLPPGSEAYALGQALSQNAGDRQSLTAPWRKFFEHWEPTGNEVLVVVSFIESYYTVLMFFDIASTKENKTWLLTQEVIPSRTSSL